MAETSELEVCITFPGDAVERVFYVDATACVVRDGQPDADGYVPERVDWRVTDIVESLSDDSPTFGPPAPPLTDDQRAAVEAAARQRWDDDQEAAAERAYERRMEGR